MTNQNNAFPFYEKDISSITPYLGSGSLALHYSDTPKEARITTHHHLTIEVMLVTSGTVSVSVEGEVYPLREGDIAIVQPKRMHRTLIHTPEKQYTRYVLHLYPELIRKFIERRGMNEADFDYLSRCCVLKCTPEDTLFARSTMDRLHVLAQSEKNKQAEYQNDAAISPQNNALLRTALCMPQAKADAPDSHRDEQSAYVQPENVYAECLVEEFLLYFAMHSDPQRQQTVPLTNPLVERAVQYINENYLDPNLSVEGLAQALFVSQGHLCRTFKKYSGGSPYNYILQKRLAHAKLLLQDRVGVLDACLQSGFQDYSSFLKLFRATYHLTPREYIAHCQTERAKLE